MKRFFKLSILIIVITISNIVNAQNELEGSIVTLDGQEIEGTIQQWDIGSNPTQISFKALGQSEIKVLAPKDIRSFSIKKSNEHYEGGIFYIELSTENIDYLSNEPDLKLERQVGFLQVIFQGEKSLYAYRSNEKNLFYIKQDSAFHLLIYKKYAIRKLVGTAEKKLVYENKKYIGQLSIYLGDSVKLQSQIQKTRYKMNDLNDLFIMYYKLTHKSFWYSVPKKNTLIKPGIVIGVNAVNMDYNFIERLYKPFDPIDEFNFVYGANCEIPLGIKKSSWYFEGLFGVYTGSFNGETTKGETFKITRFNTYKYNSFKFSTLYRYRYPIQRITLFGNLGISYEMLNGTFTQIETTSYGILSDKIVKSTSDKTGAFRMPIGCGITYKNVSLETRIEPSFDKYQGLSGSILLSYQFGREKK